MDRTPAAPAPYPAPPRPPAMPWVGPPAGLGDLAELEPTWAQAAHRAAVAVLWGAVGDAHTWSRWGYPPPAAFRRPAVVHPHPAPTTRLSIRPDAGPSPTLRGCPV